MTATELRLRRALAPFAKMHREGGDTSELACQRGVASDATYIFSRDFAEASRALQETHSRSDRAVAADSISDEVCPDCQGYYDCEGKWVHVA